MPAVIAYAADFLDCAIPLPDGSHSDPSDAAFRAAFFAAAGYREAGPEGAEAERRLVTLADAGDDLSVVPRLLALYRQGYRIVCPSRFAPSSAAS